MALKGDGKAALIALPGEKEVRLGGTFMVVSGRHRTVVGGGAACYEASESERRNDIGSPGSPPSVGQPDRPPRTITATVLAQTRNAIPLACCTMRSSVFQPSQIHFYFKLL
jgi:hypothetical protein